MTRETVVKSVLDELRPAYRIELVSWQIWDWFAAEAWARSLAGGEPDRSVRFCAAGAHMAGRRMNTQGWQYANQQKGRVSK